MRRSILTCVCSLTCLALLTGTALAQRGGGGGGHGSGGGSHGSGRSGGSHSASASHGQQPRFSGSNPSYGSHTSRTGRGSATVKRSGPVRPTERRAVPTGRVRGYSEDGGTEPGVVDGGSEETAAQYGVRITHLYEGTATRQGLLKGDVIMSFNGMATPTFEALRDAVQQSGSRAEVVFVNSENGQEESIILYPESGAIGVSGESVPVE